MHQNNRSDVTDHIIEVLVIHGAGREDLVDLILEGVEMLCECRNAACVCVAYIRPQSCIPNNTTLHF